MCFTKNRVICFKKIIIKYKGKENRWASPLIGLEPFAFLQGCWLAMTVEIAMCNPPCMSVGRMLFIFHVFEGRVWTAPFISAAVEVETRWNMYSRKKAGIPRTSFPPGKDASVDSIKGGPEPSKQIIQKVLFPIGRFHFLDYSRTKTNPTVSSYQVHFVTYMKWLQKCQKIAGC